MLLVHPFLSDVHYGVHSVMGSFCLFFASFRFMTIFRAQFSFFGMYVTTINRRFSHCQNDRIFTVSDEKISCSQSICNLTLFSGLLTYYLLNDSYCNGGMTMTHVAAPPTVVLAAATAVVPRRRRSRAQMKALDLLYPSASRDWCRGAIKAFRLATLSGTTRIHQIRAAADKTVAKTTF